MYYIAIKLSQLLSRRLTPISYSKLSVKDKLDWDDRCTACRGSAAARRGRPFPWGTAQCVVEGSARVCMQTLCGLSLLKMPCCVSPPAGCRLPSNLHALVLTGAAAYLFFLTDLFSEGGVRLCVSSEGQGVTDPFQCGCLCFYLLRLSSPACNTAANVAPPHPSLSLPALPAPPLPDPLTCPQSHTGKVIYRTNALSDGALGFSVGYFLADITYMFQNPCLVGWRWGMGGGAFWEKNVLRSYCASLVKALVLGECLCLVSAPVPPCIASQLPYQLACTHPAPGSCPTRCPRPCCCSGSQRWRHTMWQRWRRWRRLRSGATRTTTRWRCWPPRSPRPLSTRGG